LFPLVLLQLIGFFNSWLQVQRDIKLEHILRHPVTLEIFKDAMIKEHNAENLMLFLDIRRYKSTHDSQLRSLLSREIFGM
jgi:hypothetical protein